MFGFLASIVLPPWAKKALAGLAVAALAVAAFLWWLDGVKDKAVTDHEAGITTELNAQASDAAVDASEAARDTKAGIDANTARGLAKASGSADPLREAFKEW